MGVKKWSATDNYTGTTSNLKICMLEVSGTTYTNRLKLMSELIVNNLTETTPGKMLDATQGNTLEQKINIHTGNTNNSHNVTANQTGAYTSGQTDTLLSTKYSSTNPSGFTSNLGTVTNVSAITLGTSGTDLSSTVVNSTTTPTITLNIPTASATNRGALNTTDWNTFNNKVSTTRTINGHPLSSNITITANETGAYTSGQTDSAITSALSGGLSGYVPSTRKITSTIDLSVDRNLTYSDVGASPNNHNHALSGLTEKSYNSLTDKPTIPTINSTTPIGSVTMWAGLISSLPTNWHVCDGTTFDGSLYPELLTAIRGVGATGNVTIPIISIGETIIQKGPYITAATKTLIGVSITSGDILHTAAYNIYIQATSNVSSGASGAFTFTLVSYTDFDMPPSSGDYVLLNSGGTNIGSITYDANYNHNTHGGAKTVALSKANIPPHKHATGQDLVAAVGSFTSFAVNSGQSSPGFKETTDGSNDGLAGTAHNNMSPYVALQYIIRII